VCVCVCVCVCVYVCVCVCMCVCRTLQINVQARERFQAHKVKQHDPGIGIVGTIMKGRDSKTTSIIIDYAQC